MNTKPIQDFIITNERNLRIAAAVGEAWPEAREQLVKDFRNRLEPKLMKALKGWSFSTYQRFFVDGYGGFLLTKPAWKDEYFVDLTSSEFGKQMVFGVSRDASKEHIKKRAHCGAILNAVKEIYPQATAYDWWEAKIKMQEPEPDWRKPAVLWRMHTDAAFLDEVASQLIEVAKIVGPILDRFIRTL